MKFARYVLLSGIAAVFLCGPGTSAMPATQPNHFEMRFEIYGFAGLHVLTTRTNVETSATRYAITMDLSTRGLAGIFIDLESHSQVRGRLVGDRALPEEYSGEVRRDGTDRQARIEYGADGRVLNNWTLPGIEPAAYIATDQMRGTVDQLTAYFLVERELAHRNSCASVIPVFDGLHRYNLGFADAPPEALSGDIARSFPGPVWVCRMSRQDIAGSPDRSDGAYSGKIWYARLGQGDRMIPVQMEFDTAIGWVKGYLVEIHGGDIDFRLQQ
jgi:hypothetical protein